MDRASVRWLSVVVVAAACLPYLPTIDDYFTQDDFGVVQLLADKPWTTFPRWFTMPWMEDIWGYTPDEIRPFVAFTYQVTALPGAGRPELHHIVNILMHAANALLVMSLARVAIGLSSGAAASAGIVFAVLPVQAESVAWITGRVDSMPALFYFATLLAYVRWRKSGTATFSPPETGTATFSASKKVAVPVFEKKVAVPVSGAALALFFAALFSKQNTITLPATLIAYDLLVLDRRQRGSPLSAARAWLPFILMTAGYLVLRRLLFGASVRGGIESRNQLTAAGDMIERHVLRTIFGHAGPVAAWEWLALAAIATMLVVLLTRRTESIRHALVFGLGWWIIGAAPVLVAGYESPRHVYLAAAGWAFMLAILVELSDKAVAGRRAAMRAAPLVAAALLVGLYTARLHTSVMTWGSWARVSKAAVERVSKEAASAPEGTLLLVSVPRKSWEWATPFVLQPPYSPADLSGRVNLVTPFRLHCCGPEQWNVYTRTKLAEWNRKGAPIVALHFAESGAVSRMTDNDNAELRSLATILAETDSWQTLDGAIVSLLEQVVRRH